MALLRKINTEYGTSFDEAYSKVISVQFDVGEEMGVIHVNTYISKEARDNDMTPIKTDSIFIDNSKKVEACPRSYRILEENLRVKEGDILFLLCKNGDEDAPVIYKKDKSLNDILAENNIFSENFSYDEDNKRFLAKNDDCWIADGKMHFEELDEVIGVRGDFDKCFNFDGLDSKSYDNIIQQAYEFIKKRGSFARAIDV